MVLLKVDFCRRFRHMPGVHAQYTLLNSTDQKTSCDVRSSWYVKLLIPKVTFINQMLDRIFKQAYKAFAR